MAQAFWVEARGQHIRVVSQGPRQEGHGGSEGAENPDDVGVRGKLLETMSESSVQGNGKQVRPASETSAGKAAQATTTGVPSLTQSPLLTAGLPCPATMLHGGTPIRVTPHTQWLWSTLWPTCPSYMAEHSG